MKKKIEWLMFAINLAIVIIAIYLLRWLVLSTAQASERMNLVYQVKIEYRESPIRKWQVLTKKDINGLSAVQYHNDSSQQYRMILSIEKPYDVKGAFRVRTNKRSDGIVLPKNTTKAQIILGPYRECSGDICEPLTLDDVGLVELRVDLEKAKQTSMGAFLLRPFDQREVVKIRPSLKYKDSLILCGVTINKGFWIFASNIRIDGTPIDTISLCVTNPKNKTKCSKDGKFDVDVNVGRKGTYKFVMWDEIGRKTKCNIYAR